MQDSETDNVLGEYISRSALAAELGRQYQTLIAWEKDGRGPPVTRVGRSVFYRRTSVKAWLLSQESKSDVAA